MNDKYMKRYWVAVMMEQLLIMWIWLLVKLGFKRLTIDERYDLIRRRDFVMQAARGFKK